MGWSCRDGGGDGLAEQIVDDVGVLDRDAMRRRPSQHIEQSHGVGRHICDGDRTAELALPDAAMLDAEGRSFAGNDGGGSDGSGSDGGGSPTDPTNPV